MKEFPKDKPSYSDKCDYKVETLIITPSFLADVAVNRLSDIGETRNYEAMAYCAALFLYYVRGLPSDALEIETPEKIYTVTKEEKSGKISINLPKCKQIYTNKREKVDGMTLNVSARSYKNRIYKLVRCAHAEHFSDTSQRALLRSGIEDSIDGVIAYSKEVGAVKLRYVTAGKVCPSDALYVFSAVASAVFDEDFNEDKLTLKTDKLTLSAQRRGEHISLCDENYEIYTLFAPDNNFI